LVTSNVDKLIMPILVFLIDQNLSFLADVNVNTLTALMTEACKLF